MGSNTARKSRYAEHLTKSLITYSLLLAAATAQAASASDQTFLMSEVELFDQRNLVQARQLCALNMMPSLMQKIEADKRLKTKMPDVDSYCLKVLSVSKSQNRLADLYINLALQEFGYSSFHFAKQAELLKNNEPWRTTEAILRAANAGQTTYASITGKTRNLPCPLALDAGMTWANASPNAKVPIALTQAEAADISRQCYDPATVSISLRGTAYPAQKLGMIVGAWLAKQ